MEESEFRMQVYANPGRPQRAVLDAAEQNPHYRKLLEQARALDCEIRSLVMAIPVPPELQVRLHSVPDWP